MLQRKAVPEIMMGAGAPERFVPILRMRNPGLHRQDESLESASSQKSLKFLGAAANMLAKMSWVRRTRTGPRDALEIRRRARCTRQQKRGGFKRRRASQGAG